MAAMSALAPCALDMSQHGWLVGGLQRPRAVTLLCTFTTCTALPAQEGYLILAELLLRCSLCWLQVGFEDLEKWALSNPDPQESMSSGRQELAEIYLDMHIK